MNLHRIIDEIIARPFVASAAIEKIAEEIAKETLADPAFRESLRALTRAAAKRIVADLAKAETP
jgi:hypothetical protein